MVLKKYLFVIIDSVVANELSANTNISTQVQEFFQSLKKVQQIKTKQRRLGCI